MNNTNPQKGEPSKELIKLCRETVYKNARGSDGPCKEDDLILLLCDRLEEETRQPSKALALAQKTLSAYVDWDECSCHEMGEPCHRCAAQEALTAIRKEVERE